MKKTYQAKREETNPHDTLQQKHRPHITPDTLAERVSCYKEHRPEDATNIIIIETYTDFFRKKAFWKVQNTSTETGYKGPKLEATFPINFMGQMAPRRAALHHPEASLIMKHETQGCDISCG